MEKNLETTKKETDNIKFDYSNLNEIPMVSNRFTGSAKTFELLTVKNLIRTAEESTLKVISNTLGSLKLSLNSNENNNLRIFQQRRNNFWNNFNKELLQQVIDAKQQEVYLKKL